MDYLHLLHQAGLSPKEAKTYLALLELGASTIKPVADRAGIKRTSIYNFIDRLIERGLISRSTVRGRSVYQAKSPERLVDLQRDALRDLERALPEFAARANSATDKPRMSYFEGSEQTRNIVKEEPRCRKEVLYIWPGTDVSEAVGGVEFMNVIDRKRIAAGVWVRTIRFRSKDFKFKTSAHGARNLREIRYAPPGVNVSMGMGIYDTGKVSFFSSKRGSFGILVENRELEQLMRLFWEMLWHRSSPASPGEG